MAEITRYPFLRHLRSETCAHVLHYRHGELRRSGRGVSFWFFPMSASIAEVPLDDREIPLTVTARTADYQDVTVQGVVTYRIADPEALARRIDFTIDTARGLHLKQPLETIALLLAQLVQQHASEWIARTPVREVLRSGAMMAWPRSGWSSAAFASRPWRRAPIWRARSRRRSASGSNRRRTKRPLPAARWPSRRSEPSRRTSSRTRSSWRGARSS